MCARRRPVPCRSCRANGVDSSQERLVGDLVDRASAATTLPSEKVRVISLRYPPTAPQSMSSGLPLASLCLARYSVWSKNRSPGRPRSVRRRASRAAALHLELEQHTSNSVCPAQRFQRRDERVLLHLDRLTDRFDLVLGLVKPGARRPGRRSSGAASRPRDRVP